MSQKIFTKIVKLEKSQKTFRLDLFLRENLPTFLSEILLSENQISNSKIRRLILSGCVSVNGKQIFVPSYNLFNGSEVIAKIDTEKLFFEKQPNDIDFELTEKDVLFEDDFIILVNKPAFLPTEETIVEGRKNLHDCIVQYLWKKNPNLRNPPYVGIMHRLDRETSGVILFTKQRCVNAAIHEMFDSSKIVDGKKSAQKVYRAVTSLPRSGKLNGKNPKVGENFSVKFFMGRISPKSQAGKWGELSENRGGQFSHTEFKILEIRNDKIVFEAHPITGRTHQIRVHLASLGCPILGDKLYNGKPTERLMLHAESLTFLHPKREEILTIVAPLPTGF